MNVQQIREDILKNMEEVRSNVENTVNYLSGPEFRARAEETQTKIVDLANTTSQDALKLAREVSEKAVTNARQLQGDVTTRATGLLEDLRSSAGEILSSVRGTKGATGADESAA